jgi:hypothetical protein
MSKKTIFNMAISFIAIAVIYAFAKAPQQSGSLPERVSALENKVKELEHRLNALETKTLAANSGGEPTAQSNTTVTPPNEGSIKNAIIKRLKRKVPIAWSGSLMGGKNARIEFIEILQIGRYNERGRYWPVRARVKGTCEANLLSRTEQKAFDRVGEFRVFQNDYGNWVADMEGL